ncbi:MAG TPA: tetratricopeptide repeat protein [Candidatus Dormibacteraeota bacterium]|nr:tetratricopeptide repeat protein [Candidatus Dormibacteraeota bacterium]
MEGRTFGALLRAHRAEANLTQEELAERSGMSAQAISALERGTRRLPRSSTVERLAAALRLDASQKRRLIGAARGPAPTAVQPGPTLVSASPGAPLKGAAPVGAITAATPRRVFLSHTSDLGEPDEKDTFVAAAVAAVLRAGHAVTDMAYFAARDASPAAYSTAMVAESDIYLGIIGVHHGSSVRDRRDLSYTELEFDAAGAHRRPRLIFLIREDSSEVEAVDQPQEDRARQRAFRRRLLDSGLTVVQVGTPAELELAVFHALVELGPPDETARLAETQALLTSIPTHALAEPAPLPPGSRMPLAPNPLFVGRGQELVQAAATLRGGDVTVALGQVVASTGLGGLGKTQLAVELVHRYGRFFAGGVFWLSFASADEVPLQVAACAGPDFETRPLAERVQRVKDAWLSAEPRLLVFDNCEDEALLEAWRPASGGCRVLVTSRRSQWSPTLGVTVLPLDLLPRPDSIELLRRYRPDLASDDPGLDAIAHELGDLPLALHLAGSYLRAYSAEVGLDAYLAELRRSDVVQHASLLGAGLDDAISPTHHVQGVAQTFAVCLGRLDREREADRVAIALLARMACMAPGEPVPRELLAKTLEDADPLLRAEGLRRLAAVGLVEEGDGWLRLHRLLVHFARRRSLDPDARPAVDRALVECGDTAARGQLMGSALASIIPHLVELASRETDDELRLAELANAAGLALRFGGDLHAARPWLESAVAIRSRALGPDRPATARSLGNLGNLLRAQGELADAMPKLDRALGIHERTLGPDHPDTATCLHDLAALRYDVGDLIGARQLVERALDIAERVLGPDHPVTATSLNDLARLLQTEGQLALARPLVERALAIRERALGPEHPHTTRCMNDLAVLLCAQGELETARPLFERTLAIRERAHGRDHLETATSLHGLGVLLRLQEERAAATPLLDRALVIRERVLGPDHPDTVATRRALDVLTAELDGAATDG